MAKARLTLTEAPELKAICETQVRYRLVLDGWPCGEAYFNTRGYCTTHDSSLSGFIGGEQSLTALKREVARWNRTNKTTITTTP